MEFAPQDIVNEAYAHYIVNKAPFGWDENRSECVYRSPSDPEARCVMGHLFEMAGVDESEAFWDEVISVNVLADKDDSDYTFLDGTNEVGVDFLSNMQSTHDCAAGDSCNRDRFKDGLSATAEAWDLIDPTATPLTTRGESSSPA